MKRLAIALCLLLAFAPFADAKDVRVAGTTLSVTDDGGGGESLWTPNLPALEVDTTLPTGWNGTADATPADGAALETALAAVNQNGSGPYIIQLTAGATYTTATAGGFKIPNKTGSQWLIIRSSAYASLPAYGTRATSSDATNMAKIRGTGTEPALWSEFASHNVRFIGIEVTTDYTVRTSTVNSLVYHGRNPVLDSYPTLLSDVPSYVVWDRCYLHGTSTGNIRRGIQLDAKYAAVIDSYISDIHEVGADNQGILCFNSPGPILLENNYIEASCENVMFGGADPTITDLVPSDITVTHNYFFKPLTWRTDHGTYAGINWSVKNHFELKNARRVLIEGNVFKNHWPIGQGHPIVFTPRNQGGTAEWSVVDDVTFRLNKIYNCASCFNITPTDDGGGGDSAITNRMLIENNLCITDGTTWNLGTGRNHLGLESNAEAKVMGYFTVKHNTFVELSTLGAMALGNAVDDFATNSRIIDNILMNGINGFKGDGYNGGTASLDVIFSANRTWNNVVVYQSPDSNPAIFTYPATTHELNGNADVGYVNFAGGDYSITSGSYNNAASDGTDYGADISAVNAAISGVE